MDKNVRRFLAEAQRQGFRPKALRSGSMWLAPDGTSKITVHRTPSDARAFDNMVAEFRRAGMRWPVTDADAGKDDDGKDDDGKDDDGKDDDGKDDDGKDDDGKDTVEGQDPTPRGGKRKKGSV